MATEPTVLLVDDEEIMQDVISKLLNQESYRVLTASTGEEGLKKLEEETIDLILLDLMLPGIDGLEVAKGIKKDDNLAHIPIVMLTAKTEESDVIVGLEL